MSKSEERKGKKKKQVKRTIGQTSANIFFLWVNVISMLCSMLQDRDDYALELAMGDE